MSTQTQQKPDRDPVGRFSRLFVSIGIVVVIVLAAIAVYHVMAWLSHESLVVVATILIFVCVALLCYALRSASSASSRQSITKPSSHRPSSK